MVLEWVHTFLSPTKWTGTLTSRYQITSLPLGRCISLVAITGFWFFKVCFEGSSCFLSIFLRFKWSLAARCRAFAVTTLIDARLLACLHVRRRNYFVGRFGVFGRMDRRGRARAVFLMEFCHCWLVQQSPIDGARSIQMHTQISTESYTNFHILFVTSPTSTDIYVTLLWCKLRYLDSSWSKSRESERIFRFPQRFGAEFYFCHATLSLTRGPREIAGGQERGTFS